MIFRSYTRGDDPLETLTAPCPLETEQVVVQGRPIQRVPLRTHVLEGEVNQIQPGETTGSVQRLP